MPDPKKTQRLQTGAEQKTAEEVLRQIQLIVENSHDAIIGETLEGVITAWNGGARQMFGYAADEVIGKSAQFLLPPEMQDEVPKLLEKVKAGEWIADHDSVRLRKDGTRIDVAISISPIKTEDGAVIGASIVERDITTRKKAEESMRQIQLIVEDSYDAIFGVALDGMIESWNGGAATMLGYSAQEVIGRSVLFLLPPEMKDEMPALLDKIRAGDVVADYDSVRLRKDGSRIDVALSISPVKDENGKVIGASVVERDITLRKKSERHIRELNEVRNKFIAIISHQLRTPLTSVNWNLEMLMNGDFGKMEPTQHKFLEVTHAASVVITSRIHDLLTAMDIEEGRVRYETEEVALGSLCAAVVTGAKGKCELKSLTCTYAPPAADLPAIEGDGQKLRMAAAAMLENAVAYTKDGGKVTVSLRRKGDVVRFEIVDTGIGIPLAEQHLIFTRFFRASNASVMQADAFGLGLFIAKNFIGQHGGKIGFESKEGAGSTFWFELPLKKA